MMLEILMTIMLGFVGICLVSLLCVVISMAIWEVHHEYLKKFKSKTKAMIFTLIFFFIKVPVFIMVCYVIGKLSREYMSKF